MGLWWNPAHQTDHELWVATFTDEETARFRWPPSPLYFSFGSITAAEIKCSSIKHPGRELQHGYISSESSRREARESWSFLSKKLSVFDEESQTKMKIFAPAAQ